MNAFNKNPLMPLDKMRILVIADTWNYDPSEYYPIDLIISTGDVPDDKILDIANKTRCKNIFAVKGNHDSADAFKPPISDLHLNIQNFNGLTFGGFNRCWRYKPRAYFLYEQSEVSAQLRRFPYVDVFVAHNSPRGINERDQDVHQGFDEFRNFHPFGNTQWNDIRRIRKEGLTFIHIISLILKSGRRSL